MQSPPINARRLHWTLLHLKIVYALLLCVLFGAGFAFGSVEYVTVIKILSNDDKAIIQRRNGEKWLIEKGVGAISLWRYEGKEVTIVSPGTFAGSGAKLMLPDDNQEARIWTSEQISDQQRPAGKSDSIPKTDSGPQEGANAKTFKAVGLALIALNYYNPDSKVSPQNDPLKALNHFQVENHIDEGGHLGPRSMAKLAELILKNYGHREDGLALAQTLIEGARNELKSEPVVSKGTSNNRYIESTIDKVSEDGSVVFLSDGSIYEVDSLDRIKTILWLPIQTIHKTATGLINVNKAESVKAKLIQQ